MLQNISYLHNTQESALPALIHPEGVRKVLELREVVIDVSNDHVEGNRAPQPLVILSCYDLKESHNQVVTLTLYGPNSFFFRRFSGHNLR